MWRSMLSPGRASACLGIARGTVTVVPQAGAAPRVEAFTGPQDLHPAVRRGWGTGADTRRRARIVVGNDLACHWLLAPPKGATSLREIQAVARARFAELYAERADAWWITGDWRTRQPFICTAVPRWVVAGVQVEPVDAGPATWTSTVLARTLELFHRQLPNAGWCCVHSPRSLAVMHLEQGMPVALRVIPMVEGAAQHASFATAAEALQREAARQALPPVAQATWLDLTAVETGHAISPGREQAGVGFRTLRLKSRHRIAGSPAGEATVAALLGHEAGVSIS